MAEAVGISVRFSGRNRNLRAHGLQPHRVRQFKRSNDPEFEKNLRDVVELYVDPPEPCRRPLGREKSQIQVLDRTQPGLPLKKGLPYAYISLGGFEGGTRR